MKTKLFYKIFAFTFGMMLLIIVLAHVLIFMIAPSENVLITSTTVTNEDVLAFSKVDMPQLIMQTILKSFPLSFACCMVTVIGTLARIIQKLNCMRPWSNTQTIRLNLEI